MSEQLNDRVEKFCYEYCIDFNGTQAAIRAGYSEKTARQIASRLLTNVNVQNRISELQSNLAKTAGISALRVLKEHEKIAFSNAGQLRDGWITLKGFNSLSEEDKACIQEVSTKTVKRTLKQFNTSTGEFEDDPIEEEWVKIKLYDKQKSLDAINKMLGYEAPVKTAQTDKDGNDVVNSVDLTKLTNEELITYHKIIAKASGK